MTQGLTSVADPRNLDLDPDPNVNFFTSNLTVLRFFYKKRTVVAIGVYI